MSNHRNNPYAPGYQNYAQKQYGPSGQSERGTLQVPNLGGPGSSLRFASSSTSNSPGSIPLFLNPPLTNRTEQRMVSSEMKIGDSINVYVTRAREEAIRQTLSHASSFTTTQREEILPFTRTVEPSYPVTSGPKSSDADSSSSVLNWLQICKTPMEDKSSSSRPSPPSDLPGTSDGRGFTSTERQHGSQTVRGLSSYVNPTPESRHTWYSQELAAGILQRFGLEKDDLQYLLSYPEDQINSDNLPQILKQILLQKQNRAAPRHDPQPGPSFSEKDRSKMSGKSLSSMPSNTVKVSKVIKYGHTGKYSSAGTEPEKNSRVTSGGSESIFQFDAPGSSSYKEPLQQSTSQMKTGDAVPSQSQMESAVHFSWINSAVVPPVSDPTKQLHTQLSPTSKSTFASAPLKKDTDPKPLHLELSKIFTSQDLKPGCQQSKSFGGQFTEDKLTTGNSRDDQASNQIKVEKHPFEAAKQPEKEKLVNQENKQITQSNQAVNPTGKLAQLQQQFQQQQLMMQTQLQQKFQQQQLMWQAQLQQKLHLQTTKQGQAQPIKQQQTAQPLLPQCIPAVPPVSSLSFIPRQVGVSSPLLQPKQNTFQYLNYVQSSGNQQFLNAICKGIPPLVNINDYAASTPTMFPHVCSLCLTNCNTITDWLAHQNIPHHLENCKTLRRRYPEWDGEQTSTQADKRLRSPRYYHSSRDVRENSRSSSRSRSPSPWHRRNRRRSRSRSRSRSRHRCSEGKRRRRSSRSHERSSSRSKDRKRSRRSRDRRSPPDGSTPQRRRSTSAERLARKLIKSSGVRSQSDHFDLEAIVKNLTPGLLAELTKGTPASAATRDEEDSEDKVPSSNQVTLRGVLYFISYKDVVNVVEQFGKTESVVLYRSRQEAIVRFLNEEDAEKLRSIKNFDLKGNIIKVIPQKGATSATSKEQKKPPEEKSSESSVSAPPNSEAILSSTTGEANISSPKAETSAEEPKGQTDGPSAAGAEAETQPDAAEEQLTAAGDSVLVKDAEKPGEEQKAEGSKVKPAAAKTPLIKLSLSCPRTRTGESPLETPDPHQSPQAADKTPVSSPEAPCWLQSEQETPEPTAGAASHDPLAAEKTSKSVGHVSAELTQKASASSAKPTGKKWNSAYDYALDPETSRTIGDVVDTFLNDKCLRCFKKQKRCLEEDFYAQVLLINNLPEYKDGCYTEEEVAALLIPFGFKYEVDTIYIIPQTRFAFALMPTVKDVQKVVKETWNGMAFKGCELCLRPVNNKILLSPVGFYKCLMKLMQFEVTDDGFKTVLFYDISQSEIKELREVLIKNFSVRNFLPLLNKLYVEFASNHDVDLLGLSYSKHQEGRTHKLYRLTSPNLRNRTAAKVNIPPGCNPPFWLTMKTAPYIFPTVTPWFYIPNYITVSKVKSIPTTECQNLMSCAVMLTGLPEENYTVDDIAKLAWQYFPLKNCQTLYTDLIVLPLQRRAFLFFGDWSSGLNFIQDHLKNPFVIDGCPLDVFLVLQLLHPGLREEEVYKNVLKWSNHHVEDSDDLEERMLHVQTFEASVSVVDVVMSVVSSIATFVNFLPLGNRIYIEMPNSNAVVQLLEKIKSLDNLHTDERWKKVGKIEPLRNLQLHVMKSSFVVMRPRNLTKNARTKHRKGNEPAFMPRLVKPTVSAEFTASQSIKLGPSTASLEKSAVFRRVTRSLALQKSSDTPESHRTEGEQIEGTSDHTMSAESKAAPPVESESKMETSELDLEVVEETADKNQTLSDQSSGNDEKHCDQIPHEKNQTVGEENNKSKHLTEEVSETSVADQTMTEPEGQKLEAPIDAGPTENNDVNQVKDTGEDQPTTETVTELEDTSEGNLTSRSRSRTSNKGKEKSPKKRDKMIRKYEMRVKNQTEKEEKGDEGTKEVKEAEEASTSHGSGRTQTDGGVKEDQKTLNQMEKPEQVDAEKMLNSPAAGEPMITRSTRRRQKTKKDAVHEKTQTRTQHTPTKKSDAVRDMEENMDVTYVILDAVEAEEVEEDQPTTPKPRTERSKTKTQTLKKDLPNTTANTEDVWQILDSVEGEEPPAELSAAPEGDNRRTTERAASPVDTQNDQTQDEHMSKDVFIKKNKKTSETEGEIITVEASGSSAVERPTQDTTKEESLNVGGLPAAEGLVTGDQQTAPGMELTHRTKPEPESRTEAPGEKMEEPEMGSDVGGPPGAAEETAAKRRHDDITEESVTLVTSDEVGKTEEEEVKVTKSRTRGRPRKKARKTPVRKSTRGKTQSAEDEREEEKDKSPPAPMVSSSTLDQGSPAPSGELETQRMEVSTEEQQQRPESPDGQKLSTCEEEEEEKKLINVGEHVEDLVGPETKQCPDDFQLPPFDPDRPLGMEFTVRRWAHFCNLCSVFYVSENSEKDPHCCSETHYNNLKKHYQELQQNPSGASEEPHASAPAV